MTQPRPSAGFDLPLRLLAALLLVAILVSGLAVAWLRPDLLTVHAVVLLGEVRGWGALGWLTFAGIQVAVVVIGVLPASLIGIAAGAMFGILPGFLLAAIGTVLGAMISFSVSRSLFRPLAERFVRNRPALQRIDAALGADGWRFVCLIRISPVMPFAATSYVLALSSVSARDYNIGTLAALPALFGYVCMGGLADAGVAAWQDGADPLHWALLAIGIVATVLLTLRIGRIAMRALAPAGGRPAAPR